MILLNIITNRQPQEAATESILRRCTHDGSTLSRTC